MTDDVAGAIGHWIENTVIGLNLCPFAIKDWLKNRVRLHVSDAQNETSLLEDLAIELRRLTECPSIETTLLIHPKVLQSFDQYNQFLDTADWLLEELHVKGEYQVASFHPEYQFADSEPNSVENYTNRSPYPVLHLLRETSLEYAINMHSDTEKIPHKNIQTVQEIGLSAMKRKLNECYEFAQKS